jgi:hypothetical protein
MYQTDEVEDSVRAAEVYRRMSAWVREMDQTIDMCLPRPQPAKERAMLKRGTALRGMREAVPIFRGCRPATRRRSGRRPRYCSMSSRDLPR